MVSDELPHAPAKRGDLPRAAALVAAGILASRLAGLVRQTLITATLGYSDVADAFTQALRVPNFLQNMLGEGAMSASFIPVYAGLLGLKRAEDADRVARAVLALLALVTAVLVLAGIVFTPDFMPIIAWGYTGPKRDLIIQLVRILFPGVGLLVFSAWCLTILNSHGRFFLSYAAPVVWNASIITALVIWRHAEFSQLAVALAWGAVAGSVLQVAVQLPTVWDVMTGHWSDVTLHLSGHVRTVLRNFMPVFLSRGVVQVSAFIDSDIASLLGQGAAAALANAQTLALLPVSLFGISVSASELPAMSRHTGDVDTRAAAIRARLARSQPSIVVLVVPSALAFLAFGDVVSATLFQHLRFTHGDAVYTWALLAGSSVGLLSSTLGRLYSAAFYAIGDTATPLKYATCRIVIVAVLGYLCAVPLPHLLGINVRWGAAGLTTSAGLAGWVEFALLRRGLGQRIGRIASPASVVVRTWSIALVAALVAVGGRWLFPISQPLLRGIVILGAYGGTYLALANWLKLLTFKELTTRIRR